MRLLKGLKKEKKVLGELMGGENVAGWVNRCDGKVDGWIYSLLKCW